MYNAINKMDAYSFKCTGVFTTNPPARSRWSPGQARTAGAEASRQALAAAAANADDGSDPPSDLRAAADYRRHLARVLTGRALAATAGVS